MKLLIILTLLIHCNFQSIAENPTLSKRHQGFQAGAASLWYFSDYPISDNTSVGIHLGISGLDWESVERNAYIIAPRMGVHGKWFYSNKTEQVSATTDFIHHSGSFFGLKTTFIPSSLIMYQSNELFPAHNSLTIIPQWGSRRNVFKNLQVESAIGLGYRRNLVKNPIYFTDKRIIFDWHLRLNYIIK
jgi:hypothetical protein